jgi:hypothetical protein
MPLVMRAELKTQFQREADVKSERPEFYSFESRHMVVVSQLLPVERSSFCRHRGEASEKRMSSEIA